jgi:hypothetical protein
MSQWKEGWLLVYNVVIGESKYHKPVYWAIGYGNAIYHDLLEIGVPRGFYGVS